MTVPHYSRDGNTWTFTWQAEEIRCVVSRVTDTRYGLRGRLLLERLDGQAILYADMALGDMRDRERIGDYLAGRDKAGRMNWRVMLETVAFAIGEAWTAAKVPLSDPLSTPIDNHPRTLVPRFLPRELPTVLYGPGGTGKSFLGLLVLASVMTGHAMLPGLEPTLTGPVMLLDYESTLDETNWRLRAILRGWGLDSEAYRGMFYYASPDGPFDDHRAELGERAKREGVVCAVLDSLMSACRESANSAEEARGIIGGLLSWTGVTPIAIGHINKEEMGNGRNKRHSIFGSAFFENLARSTFEARQSEDMPEDEGIAVALYNSKTNRLRVRPFGLRLDITSDRDGMPLTISTRAWDVMTDRSLSEGLPLWRRAASILARVGKASTADIARELQPEADDDVLAREAEKLRRELNRKSQLFMQVTGALDAGGRGRHGLWALRERNRG